MKIKCDQCGAKYQVADEKVRHKVFKIRCKRCENAIVVRADDVADEQTAMLSTISADQQNGDEEATRQIQRDAIGQEGDNTVWHIVVNREQKGPLTPQEIAGYLGRGEVDGEAFIWKDGLGDWQKMSTVPQFSHLFPGGAAAVVESTSAGPAFTEGPPGLSVTGGPMGDGFSDEPSAFDANEGLDSSNEGPIFPQPAGDDDVLMSSPATDGSDGIFAQADAQAAADPRIMSSDQLREQRNENSVLFSLDSLDASAQAHRPQVSNTGGEDGSGLIDISMLASSLGGDKSEPMFGGDSPGAALAGVSAPQQMPSLVTRRRTNTGLVVGMTMGALILAGAVGTAVYFATKNPPAVSTSNSKASKKKGVNATALQTPAKPSVTGTVATAKQIGNSNAQPVTKTAGLAGSNGPNPSVAARGAGQNLATPGASPGVAVGATTALNNGSTPAGTQGTPAGTQGSAVATTAKQPATGTAQPNKAGSGQPAAAKTDSVAKKKKSSVRSRRKKSKARRNRSRQRSTDKTRASTSTGSRATPIPVAKPVATRKKPQKPKKRGGGDEVDELLGSLNGTPRAKSNAPAGRGRTARAAAPAGAGDPLLPEKPSRAQIISVIKRNTKYILNCKEKQPDLRGILKVRVSVKGTTGRVSKAAIVTGKFQGTSVGDCVAQTVKTRFRFPQFRNSVFSVNIPFRL